MIQLSIMAMILGAAVPMAMPAPRSRGALIAAQGVGGGIFVMGLAGLGYALMVTTL